MAYLLSAKRSRVKVNYKTLHEGTSLPKEILKKACVTNVSVLPGSYSVERIISKKETSEVSNFNIKYIILIQLCQLL